MFNVRVFFIKLAQGFLTLLALSILPAVAHIISGNFTVVFIAWLVQLVLFAGAMVYFRERIKNWLWLSIVAASPIIMFPILLSHVQYLLLALLPVNTVELAREALPVIRPRINTVLKAPGARVKTSGEIWYTKTESYESEDPNNPGHFDKRTSTTEYHFVPVFWADGSEGDAFGLIEYNSQVKETFGPEKYNYLEDAESLPALYFIPGGSVLKGEADLTYRETGRGKLYGLAPAFMPIRNAFSSETEMRDYINSKITLPVVFFLIVFTGFVVIPAVSIARRK